MSSQKQGLMAGISFAQPWAQIRSAMYSGLCESKDAYQMQMQVCLPAYGHPLSATVMFVLEVEAI